MLLCLTGRDFSPLDENRGHWLCTVRMICRKFAELGSTCGLAHSLRDDPEGGTVPVPRSITDDATAGRCSVALPVAKLTYVGAR